MEWWRGIFDSPLLLSQDMFVVLLSRCLIRQKLWIGIVSARRVWVLGVFRGTKRKRRREQKGAGKNVRHHKEQRAHNGVSSAVSLPDEKAQLRKRRRKEVEEGMRDEVLQD